MNLDVVFTAKDCIPELALNKNIIVIDVLRATSVIVTALNNGAKSIKTFLEIEKAFDYKNNNNNILLGGERNALKIDGFDFSNSPLEYTKEKVFNKEIALTTTNGTKAIQNGSSGDNLFILSFLNISSVVEKILHENKDTLIICSGTNNEFTYDDVLCASLFINKIMYLDKKISLTDKCRFLNDFSIDKELNLHELLKNTIHYKYLLSLNLNEDLDYCLTIDKINIIPFLYTDNKIYI